MENTVVQNSSAVQQQPRQNIRQLNQLLRTLKRSPATQDCKAINSRHDHRSRLFHMTPSQKDRLKSMGARRRKKLNPIHDPIIEEILLSVDTRRISRKRLNQKIRNRKRLRFDPEFKARRNFYPRDFEKKSGDPTRGSMVIIVFAAEDGRRDILLQMDKNDDGTPKGGWGFVIGGADSTQETDEQIGQRETHEETGIPSDVGTITPVGIMNVDKNYYVAVFVKVVPFDTTHKPGKEVYMVDGKPCQDRYSKKVLLLMRNTRNFLLRKHDVGLEMAIQKGLI